MILFHFKCADVMHLTPMPQETLIFFHIHLIIFQHVCISALNNYYTNLTASFPGQPVSAGTHKHTHTRLTGLCPGLPRWASTRDKTNLDFTEERDSERQWHQLGRMQVCTSLQTYNHASTSPLIFLQAGCPSCRPTNSVKALKAQWTK